MIVYYAFVGNSYAAAFLTSVLKRKKSVIASICGADRSITENAENSAFLMKAFAETVIE